MQLAPLPDGHSGFEAFELLEAGATIGVVGVKPARRTDGDQLDGGLTVWIAWANVGSQEAASEVVETIEQFARERSTSTLQLATADELTRYAARAHGYTGSLRTPLVRDISSAPDPGYVTADLDPAARLAAVAQLLPDCRVEMRNHGVGAVFGREAKLVDFVVAHPALPKGLTVRVPNRTDTMPEAVASVIDTAIAVLTRYPVGILRISCENASYDLGTGAHAGETFANVGMVYLNPSYVLAADMEKARQSWFASHPGSRRTPMVPEPFTRLDAIVAHELWHRIEDANHKANWIEIHRALGEELGVDTLEHALRGGSEGAPAAWQYAYRRMVSEVSNYATTNPREAKAEMFMLWWFRDENPAPVVARFGALIERELP